MKKISSEFRKFPLQFWLILLGALIFTTGSSLVWPFLTIYLQERLGLPLRLTTLLFSIRSVSGILCSTFSGSLADRYGRRTMMLISLMGGVVYYVCIGHAFSAWHFALLFVMWGILELFFPVGANAMIADLTEDEHRLEAYSLLRMVDNVGYAIGPVIGGFLAAKSYSLLFRGATLGYGISFVLLLFTIKETLTDEMRAAKQSAVKEPQGLGIVLKDKAFFLAVLMMGTIYIGSSPVFHLLSTYAQNMFGIAENQISFVYTVNAVMCIFLQLPVVRFGKGRSPFRLLTIAGVLYWIGISGYSAFPFVPWYCCTMVIMTFGELMMSPTMSGLAAHLAPANARGRYMSVLSLAQPLGLSIGLTVLGFCYDTFNPRLMWVIGALFPLTAAIGYHFLEKKYGKSDRFAG